MPKRRSYSGVRRALAAGVLASALSVSGHAQGTVTLYGVLDTSIELTDPGNGWTPRLDSGAYRGSRIGLRGDEPLGGGNHLLFELENGFSSADGSLATAGTLFNRQAWVGGQGRFGEIRIGRQYSPIYIPFKGQLDAFGAGTIASGLNNLSKITPYSSDAIAWLSPELSGFSATLMYALRDAADEDGNGFAGYYATFEYRLDGLRLLYARQQTHGAGALRSNLGGVSYSLGNWQAWLSFFNGDGGTPAYHGNGMSASVRYRFSPSASLSLGYARVTDKLDDGASAEQFSASFEYALSRTLLMYLSAADLLNRGNATFTLRGVNVTGLPAAYPGAPVKGMQVGLIERF
ncbi:porin [Paraburkholderia dilworthii]|uniref:porin n=1 Tax=Paraburkholderia dilworthii TaxID=948106 RepID=UPI0004043DBC|nr:porin [Paraburkholderia dilworthii]